MLWIKRRFNLLVCESKVCSLTFLGFIFKETSFNSVDGAQMIEKSEKLVKMSIPYGLLQWQTARMLRVWQDIQFCDNSLKAHKKQTQISTYTLFWRIHTVKKPFRCAYCDKIFACADSLNTYEKSHKLKTIQLLTAWKNTREYTLARNYSSAHRVTRNSKLQLWQ